MRTCCTVGSLSVIANWELTIRGSLLSDDVISEK